MSEQNETPQFPHISLRCSAFYIIFIVMSMNTVFSGITNEEFQYLTGWLAFIVLILLQIFGEVWALRNPDPRDKEKDDD